MEQSPDFGSGSAPRFWRNEMNRNRVMLGSLVVIAVLAALALGGLVGESTPAPAASASVDGGAEQLLEGFADGDTASYVRDLERRVAENPRDGRSLGLLGLAYQQRARETGDLSFYERSASVLDRAIALNARDHLSVTALAALAASRHRFDEALQLARRAVALSPKSAAPYGILGDSLLELGRYEEAFVAFDRMVALKPSAASYARISYGREILGDTAGAIAAMELAAEAAQPTPEPTAWALTNLANLHVGSGDTRRASRLYGRSLALVPRYAPALAGLARVATYRDRPATAARLYGAALDAAPVPEYAGALGDALAAAGRHASAEEAWAKAETLERDFVRNGGRNELETALFDLDHDRNMVGALERARIGRTLRPSVEGEHVLAWALYKTGSCAEARIHSIRALRLGTKDVGALMHRSLIERCLGNEQAARAFRERAFALNPYADHELGSPRQSKSGTRSRIAAMAAADRADAEHRAAPATSRL